ncbi:MAG: ATP-binding cassette domain-containing protein [Methanomicrobium sp.]|nr:ATP-binding cassette domain-containing protein [Methanomicrobium sp.]
MTDITNPQCSYSKESSKNCLTIENFSITLGDFNAENLNLKVGVGEYCIVLGPTGAGKTILLETIAGIHRLKTGKIYLHGRDITDIPPELRGIGIVYQDYMLFPHMTVGDNIAFGLKQRGVSKEERERQAAEIAGKLGIDHLLGRYPQTLSGGEKQRAAIARAVILKPKVLLLDEPLSALDNTTRESLRRELKKLHKEMHTTIIHITHHFEDIYSLADRVVVMREGSIIQCGSVEEIVRKPDSRFIADFTGMENVFSGICTPAGNETAEIDIGGLKIHAVSDRSGDVNVGIRPEELIISKEKLTSSARNSVRGEIVKITDNGIFSKIAVAEEVSGTLFTAALTKQSIESMNIGIGDTVYLTFKATAVHVF